MGSCLEHGANHNLNKVDEFKSILAATAKCGSLETIALLLKHGALLQGSVAIVIATEAGKEDVVRYLLDQGADVNEIGEKNGTDEREALDMGSALHKAAAKGNKSAANFLLDRGAEIELKEFLG